MAETWFQNSQPNRFHCISVDAGKASFTDGDNFKDKLEESLKHWKSSGIRGVSIRIPIEKCALIDICRQLNFDFHHAQPGYVRMEQWLLENEPSQLPVYATQYIGAGGFVVNNQNQLLVIKEKFFKNPCWKLPGGHVDAGEDITVACQREVFEETGVTSEFVSMLGFRHQHNYRFGCSDIYFVCLMKPVNGDINPCEKEIAECKWMDLEDYLKSDITDGNRYYAELYQKQLAHGKGIQPQSVLSHDKAKANLLYCIQPLNQPEKH